MAVALDGLKARTRERMLRKAVEKEVSTDLLPLVERAAERLLEPDFDISELDGVVSSDVRGRFRDEAELGCELQEYLVRWRIEAVKDALVAFPEEKVAWLGFHVGGYASRSALNRAFKRYADDLSPSEYRERHRHAEPPPPADDDFDALWVRATVGDLDPYERLQLRARLTGRALPTVELKLSAAPDPAAAAEELSEMLAGLDPEERRFWRDHVLRVDSAEK
jgi:AraC-like DNA-binding protein